MAATHTIRVALDWTPNTIHTGLFLALEKGLYTSAGLAVELIPVDPEYRKTPAQQLLNHDVDLAICPSESCIAYNENRKMALQAVYAILQRDASAIVTLREGPFAHAAGLERGTYGSYNARYEDHIVRDMVANDGGSGSGLKIRAEFGKLSLFEELKKGSVDATWVFLPWEGVEAETEGVGLNVFRPEDYGVPYGYSPVIARDAGRNPQLPPAVLKRFVDTTRRGYEYAMEHVEEAAEVMEKHCQPHRSREFLVKSQMAINEFYSDGTVVGSMQENKWARWIHWLQKHGLMKPLGVELEDVYTNEFIAS